MDDRWTETLEELRVRGDAAMLDTRRMIAEILTLAEQTRRIIERDRPWMHSRMDAVAEDVK